LAGRGSSSALVTIDDQRNEKKLTTTSIGKSGQNCTVLEQSGDFRDS